MAINQILMTTMMMQYRTRHKKDLHPTIFIFLMNASFIQEPADRVPLSFYFLKTIDFKSIKPIYLK